MKKLYYIIGVAVLLAVSCERELNWNEESSSEEGIALSFSCSDMATRAVDGVGNENLIKQIDYFIFPYGEEEKVADDAEYVYTKTLVPKDNGLAGTYKDTIQTGVLNQIFANGFYDSACFTSNDFAFSRLRNYNFLRYGKRFK